MSRKEYWLWLSNIKNIGICKIEGLLEVFQDPEAVFVAREEEIKKVKCLSKKDIQCILHNRSLAQVQQQYGLLREKNIQLITREDKEYPKRLKEIYNSPVCLYVRGSMPKQQAITLAVVGARNCSNYGKEMAMDFAFSLARAGVQVVSGLARGIDGYAHQGALNGGGPTFGILGCGIDICYPSCHLEMFMNMQEHGGVISEYGIGVSPNKWNFPMRNRLISGFSDGILVVEAREKSGSLITVDMALEQGKDVFVVPGRIGEELSKGCNNLIKMGASLVTTPEDIFFHYHIPSTQWEQQGKEGVEELTVISQLVYKNVGITPKHINEIVEDTGCNLQELMEILMDMELKGYIKEITKNYYARFFSNEK